MRPFPSSFAMKYILAVVDYVSKWIEAHDLTTNDAKQIAKFIRKNIFARYGTLRAIISDEGNHFYNRIFEKLLKKYGV